MLYLHAIAKKNEKMRLTDDQGLPRVAKDPVVKLDIVGDNDEPIGPG